MSLDAAAVYMPFLIAIVACLYASVGHGGASGYLALLSLTTLSAKSSSAAALALNLVVASIAFFAFRQRNHFSWRLSWPLLLGAAPFAYLGSRLVIHEKVYFVLVGLVVAWAGLRLLLAGANQTGEERDAPPPIPVGIATGAGIGLLSGVVGIGGGIFLSPILVLTKWADAKRASATSAIFIVSNSAIGLGVRAGAGISLPPNIPWLIVGGAIGAIFGAWIGAKLMPVTWLRRFLGAVLLVAAVNLLLKG
ncbi:MAG: sulfite exporter TauE/SafE family protein [Fimbriimonadaceae bacterium]